MFKKFNSKDIAGNSQAKSSAQRAIRKKILEKYPSLENEMRLLFPKKAPMFLVKCPERVTLVVMNGEPLFLNIRDGDYYPTLRLLHKYPDLLPKVGVDKGAIKHVMKGAPIMCPGLTSEGGDISTSVPTETGVAIMAEGKTHALGIGITAMSTEDMASINSGVGINSVTYLNDGLWNIGQL